MDLRHRLDHLTLLKVTGADRDAFLQGQLSNDISALSENCAQLTSLNSPKGRVLAVMQAVRDRDAILLALPASIAVSVRDRLRMFILRSHVALDMDENHGLIGLSGDAAGDRVANLTGVPAPAGDWICTRGNGLIAWRQPGSVERFLIAGEHVAVEASWTGCDGATEDPGNRWRAQDILARMPEIVPATQDAFVAQMLGLDTLGAVSFSKGCYIGQEVIARAHYLGKVKRHVEVGCAPTGANLTPGTVLQDETGQSAATLVSVAPHPDGGLAVLTVHHRDYPAGTVLATESGAAVSF